MRAIKIAKDRKPSEYELQREAHTLLIDALGDHFIVRGEYTYGGCKFDLAVFNAETRDLICTIEIKRKIGGPNKKHAAIKQTNKYHRRTDKPCILLTEGSMHSAIAYLKKNLTSRASF